VGGCSLVLSQLVLVRLVWLVRLVRVVRLANNLLVQFQLLLQLLLAEIDPVYLGEECTVPVEPFDPGRGRQDGMEGIDDWQRHRLLLLLLLLLLLGVD
jgi:hypothetical protein